MFSPNLYTVTRKQVLLLSHYCGEGIRVSEKPKELCMVEEQGLKLRPLCHVSPRVVLPEGSLETGG